MHAMSWQVTLQGELSFPSSLRHFTKGMGDPVAKQGNVTTVPLTTLRGLLTLI